jgi:hypothetical protein
MNKRGSSATFKNLWHPILWTAENLGIKGRPNAKSHQLTKVLSPDRFLRYKQDDARCY